MQDGAGRNASILILDHCTGLLVPTSVISWSNQHPLIAVNWKNFIAFYFFAESDGGAYRSDLDLTSWAIISFLREGAYWRQGRLLEGGIRSLQYVR